MPEMNHEVEEENRKSQGGPRDKTKERWVRRNWKIRISQLGSFHFLLQLLEHVTFRVLKFHLNFAN
jgi:hypothetical protein